MALASENSFVHFLDEYLVRFRRSTCNASVDSLY